MVFSSGASVQHFMLPNVERADFSAWPTSQCPSHPATSLLIPLLCYNENQLFAALPPTHHLSFLPLCLCPSCSFQSLSLHSTFIFNLLESISRYALHQLLHDCTPAWMRSAPSFHSTSAALYSLYLLLSILSKCSCLVLASSWVPGRQILCLFHLHIISAQDSFGQILADTVSGVGWGEGMGGWMDGWCLKRKHNMVSLRRHSMSWSQTGWVLSPALSQPCCVILARCLNFFKPPLAFR